MYICDGIQIVFAVGCNECPSIIDLPLSSNMVSYARVVPHRVIHSITRAHIHDYINVQPFLVYLNVGDELC